GWLALVDVAEQPGEVRHRHDGVAFGGALAGTLHERHAEQLVSAGSLGLSTSYAIAESGGDVLVRFRLDDERRHAPDIARVELAALGLPVGGDRVVLVEVLHDGAFPTSAA